MSALNDGASITVKNKDNIVILGTESEGSSLVIHYCNESALANSISIINGENANTVNV